MTRISAYMRWKQGAGTRELLASIFRLEKAADKYAKSLVYRAAEEFVNKIRRDWSEASPSPPYSPPAIRSGNLDESVMNSLDDARDEFGRYADKRSVKRIFIQIDPSKPGGSRRRFVRSRGRRRKYATYLEKGTRQMEPRPFVMRALNHVEREFPSLAGKTAVAFRMTR